MRIAEVLSLLILGLLVLSSPLGVQAADSYARLELLDEAQLDDLITTADQHERAAALIVKATWLAQRDPAAALASVDAAAELLEAGDALSVAYLNAVRCWSLQHMSQMADARRACQAAVSAGEAAGDPRALSRALTRQSIAHFNSGDLELAGEVAQRALQQAELAAESGQLAVVLSALGRIARAQGLYDQSLAYYSRGLQLIDRRVDQQRYRVLAFNVGLSHADLGQFEIAQDYYRETLAWTREVRSLRKEMTALIYIAKADIGLGEYARAIESMESAVAREEFQFDPGHLAFAYSVLGDAYLAAGDAGQALQRYRHGLQLAAGNDNRFEQRELRLGLSQALLATGEPDSAKAVIESLMADLREEGAGKMLISALLAHAGISEVLEDPGTALASFREAARLGEDRNRMVANQRLAVARAEFEIDAAELALARAQRDGLIRNGLLGITAAGLLICYLFFSRRIQAQLAQTRKLKSARLEKLVAERTAALQTELMRRSEADEQRIALQQRLAEDDKLRVLGQLTGGVAHDFNNLLMVVMGSAELLQAKNADLSEADQQLLEHIVAAAQSGAGITRALMAYARQQPLHLQNTNLISFLEARLPLLERTLGGSLSIVFENDTQRATPVLLDQDQLTTALLNLTLNARDAQGSAGLIRIVLAEEADNQASLTVIDKGVGMSPEQVRRACEPFYSTKHEGEGNGLGLSMVYGFAKQLGGELIIRSTQGQGTAVKMLLPLVDSAVDLEVA